MKHNNVFIALLILLLITSKNSIAQEPVCNSDKFNNQHSDNQQWNDLLDKACTEINTKKYFASLKTLEEAMTLDSLVSVGGYVRNKYIEIERIRIKNYLKDANITEDPADKNNDATAKEDNTTSDKKEVTTAPEETSVRKVRKGSQSAFKNLFIENSDMDISVDNVVATANDLSMKISIVNKTNDFIIYKCAESKIIYKGKEYKPLPTERDIIISPMQKDIRELSISCEGLHKAQNTIFVLSGFYRIPSTGNNCYDTTDFVLPVAIHDFESAGFKIKLTNAIKETKGIKVFFSVTYTGNSVGYVFPATPKLLMPDQNEYPCNKPINSFANADLIPFKKGETKVIRFCWDKIPGDNSAMDMERAFMIIEWFDTFCELAPAPLPPFTKTLEKE